MLSTMQELEQEINLFHKNLKNSNTLMKLLTSVVSTTQAQTDSFASNAGVLHRDLSTLPQSIDEAVLKRIDGLIQELETRHRAYEENVASLLKRFSGTLSDTESAIMKVPPEIEAQLRSNEKYFSTEVSVLYERICKSIEEENASFTGQMNSVMSNWEDIRVQLTADIEQGQQLFLKSLKQDLNGCVREIKDLGTRQDRNLNTAVDAIQLHSISFSSASDDLRREMSTLPQSIDEAVLKRIDGLIQELETRHRAYEENVASLLKRFSGTLSDTESAIMKIPPEIEAQLQLNQKRFSDEVSLLRGQSHKLLLEHENIDQIYKLCQEMNQSVNTKLTIAIACAAISAVVAIISLIL